MYFSYRGIDIPRLFKVILLSLILSVCVTGPSSGLSAELQSAKLIEIETRMGVTQEFILIKPANPVASVIIFEGGKGDLKLKKTLFGSATIGKKMSTFLIRNRKDFARQGFAVAIVDAPSDQKSGKALLEYSKRTDKIFRMSDDHIQDIMAIVSYLKKEANIPVWLIGISWGTVSASNGAIEIKDGVNGLVLASSMTHSPKKFPIHKSYPECMLNMGLHKITVPTLIISNKDDKCPHTPASDAPKLKEALKNSAKVQISYFEGGKSPQPDYRSKTPADCQPLTPHGFYGIEKQVISAIADFIKSNSQH